MIHPGVRTPLPRSSIRKRAKSKRPEGGWVQAPFGLLVFKNLSQHVNTERHSRRHHTRQRLHLQRPGAPPSPRRRQDSGVRTGRSSPQTTAETTPRPEAESLEVLGCLGAAPTHTAQQLESDSPTARGRGGGPAGRHPAAHVALPAGPRLHASVVASPRRSCVLAIRTRPVRPQPCKC